MQQDDYIGDDVPDDIKEIMQTSGIHKGVLEVRNLKANTELCVQTLKNLKYQNITNLGFLIFGSIFSFTLSYYFNNDNKKYNEKVDKLIIEKNTLKTELENSRKKNELEILELKKEILNLNKKPNG